jgi:hypothetical protein
MIILFFGFLFKEKQKRVTPSESKRKFLIRAEAVNFTFCFCGNACFVSLDRLIKVKNVLLCSTYSSDSLLPNLFLADTVA